jgi:hypothetical protein
MTSPTPAPSAEPSPSSAPATAPLLACHQPTPSLAENYANIFNKLDHDMCHFTGGCDTMDKGRVDVIACDVDKGDVDECDVNENVI